MSENEEKMFDDLNLIDYKELCRLLKINISSAQRISSSELKRIHIGRLIRFKRSSVMEYINKMENKEIKSESN